MKIERQSKILELIQNYEIETQEELADRLKNAGFEVTQATISRDIRELKLTKIATDHGAQKYAVFSTFEVPISDRFIRIFKEAVISMDYAQNILVIKTLSGMAMAVGAALDALHYKEIIGSIAGDDTIFSVVKTEQQTIQLMEKLGRLMHSNL